LLRHAVTALESLGIGAYHSLLVLYLAEACMLAEQQEDALAAAERALTLARDRGERGYEAWALRLLGEIASHSDRPDVEAGKEHYRQAMVLAEELGLRPLVAHCHLGLGKLCLHTGKRQEAPEHLATAANMFREMEMQFWLDKAEVFHADQGGLGSSTRLDDNPFPPEGDRVD
jgi:tetratricopeptide (TPR) repeat protein